MPRGAPTSALRRWARRHLPHRVRAAGLELLGRPARPPAPNRKKADAQQAAKRAARKAAAKKAARAAKVRAPAPKPVAGAVLLEALNRGESMAAAVSAEVRALLAGQDHPRARSLAASLQQDPASRAAGDLAAGIVAASGGYPELTWSLLRDLPREAWARHAPDEYVRAGLRLAPEATLEQVRGLLGGAGLDLPPASWLNLIGPVFAYGDQSLAGQLYARLDAQVGDGSDVKPDLVVQRDWLRPWVAMQPDGRSAPDVPTGSTSFAIMDYGHPGRSRASANIGDHVQSIASLGHLARHTELSYDGPQDLIDLMEQLRGRVRPDRALEGPESRVQLLKIDRDASMYAEVPPRTWTLAFGWYMHAIFDFRYGFPFHPNLLPIFVSFHCNRREMLTDEAIDYLRRFAPIGCRDWTTVDVLLSVGVPAFFSGCLTTTVNTVFPDQPATEADPARPVAYVDMPREQVPKGAATFRHSYDAVRFRSFTANVYAAVDLLETYRREYRGLVSSRLHCYLPVRSLGVPVDFQPKNRSDPRFAGLIDITDAEFNRMQSTINDKLATVTTAILAGTAPDEVYGLWAELNADDVAAAQRRRAETHPMPQARVDLRAELATVAAASTDWSVDPVSVNVAVLVSDGGLARLPVLLGSVLANTARPVTFWLVSRDLTSADVSALSAVAGAARINLVNPHGIGADLRTPDGRTPTLADIDLFVLPDLLPPLDRLVVLPDGAVVSADIGELADLDLQGHLLAAPTVNGLRGTSGFGLLHAAGSRLGSQTRSASELRRRAHARHRFDFDAFHLRVLVIDGAQWRDRDLLSTYVPYIEEFGLTVRDLLHFEIGPNRAEVPSRWHVVPTRSPVEDPALVRWADEPTPWSGFAAPERERWVSAQARFG